MYLGFQETPVPARPFDPDVVWQVFSQLFARLLAHLPYLILGFVVFVLFLIAARLVKRIFDYGADCSLELRGNRLSGVRPTIEVKPQFLHSYLSPSDKPGVSQVILQVGQVVKGRLELRLRNTEFSVCIVALIIGDDA